MVKFCQICHFHCCVHFWTQVIAPTVGSYKINIMIKYSSIESLFIKATQALFLQVMVKIPLIRRFVFKISSV